jgi:integrase
VRKQKGCIWYDKQRKCWFGRWTQDEIRCRHCGKPEPKHKDNGHTFEPVQMRVKMAKVLVDFKQQPELRDLYRTERDVRPLLEEKLRPLNQGKLDVRSTMTIGRFVDELWLPYVQENLRPSTVVGYRKEWNQYLKPRIGDIVLRDFRTMDAANVLNDLARYGLNRHSLRRAKSIMSAIFSYAKNVGVLDGLNPVRDTIIPKNAKPPSKTYAYTMDEVLNMLDALKGKPKARAAIALMYFAGLMPAEARGLRWEDYEPVYNYETGQWDWRLSIQRNVWRTHESETKTEHRAKPVMVIEPLRTILAHLRSADGNPQSGPILRGRRGRPLHLDNLVRREIIPALRAKGIQWHGMYALRRGIGTRVTAETKDPLAAKGLLRHSSVATTAAHYIKDVPENTRLAMQMIEQRTLALMAKRESQMNEPVA